MRIRYGTIRFGTSTAIRRITGRPDTRRWSDLGSFEPEWASRAELIAGLVPLASRVIEFGAGTRRLEGLLDPDSSYTPSDVIDRGPGTLVLDLNARPLPSLSAHRPDVAVFAGVLEYLRNLPDLARWLAGEVFVCIASYECAASRRRTWARVAESVRRTQSGWVNTLHETEFVALFGLAGFDCIERRTWKTPTGDERIFVFRVKGELNRPLQSTP